MCPLYPVLKITKSYQKAHLGWGTHFSIMGLSNTARSTSGPQLRLDNDEKAAADGKTEPCLPYSLLIPSSLAAPVLAGKQNWLMLLTVPLPICWDT